MRTVAAIGLMFVLAGTAPAQARPQTMSTAAALDCRACHTSNRPTKANPALRACPRLQIKGFHSVDEAPPTVTLGDTGGVYGPVKFSHRAHATMAEMGTGCSGCHHYDQAGPIQKCSACHSETRARTDLGKPDVKAAMHRQCMQCHLEWSPATKCAMCHQQGGKVANGSVAVSVKAPQPAAPERVVYQTRTVEGKTVTFFHNDHVNRFGLACASCHQQETCATCHRVKPGSPAATTIAGRPAAKSRTAAEAHARCSACHTLTGRCATCHAGTEAKAVGFDHKARTGWALNRFHAPLACVACHTTPGKFTAHSTDCASCHKNWQAVFDHKKTGLALDETHVTLDCVSCHEDKTFTAAPVCSSCHADKSYPADKPGKKVARPVTRT